MDNSDDDMLDFGEDNSYSYDGSDDDFGLAEDNEAISSESQLAYVVLKDEDIRKLQKDDIERVSTVLSLSKVEVIVLLLHYRWSVNKVEDEWFTDEERVRKLVGLLKKQVVDVNGKEVNIECKICFGSYTRDDIENVSCGHRYCKTCWSGYISTKIKDGPGCLRFKCPEPSCSAVVGQDMIDKLTKEDDKEKYYRYFLRSYIEQGGKRIKWCPSPGCEYAIDYGIGSGSNYDVSCLCCYSFCWNCCEDAHRPVDCETVAKWIFKNEDEAENTNWILANWKPCPNPKCKRPIEKNQGCNHMRCSLCKHEFCWLCLGKWYHGYKCNKYKSDDETTTKRMRAKNALDRYAHYYERWAGNQLSRLKAIEGLEKLQSVQLKELAYRQSTSENQLQFTLEAWLQIIECRRVLKWTYAYGYYLPQHELAKKQLFEYLQGEAESGLERLHHCAEMELNQFVDKTEGPTQDFNVFRNKLVALTNATKTYFENLVKALENGLADVAAYSESDINNN